MRRQLRVTALALALSLLFNAVCVVAMLLARRTRYARAIMINDRIVCYVKNVQAAEQLQQELLEEKRANLTNDVHFQENWKDLRVSVEHEPVLTKAQAAEVLRPLLHILVSCYAISVDGEDVVYVATEDAAKAALDLVKTQYVAPGEEVIKQEFKENVEIRPTSVPPEDLQTDIHAAAETLSTGQRATAPHKVRSGECPSEIAGKYGMSLKQLLALNPNLRRADGKLRDLVVGEELSVTRPTRRLTVRTVKEVTQTAVPYSAKPQVQETTLLPPGKEEVTVPGVPGEQSVRLRLELENDQEISRERLEALVTKPAIPARIRRGVARSPSP